jgi:hypothetical protein
MVIVQIKNAAVATLFVVQALTLVVCAVARRLERGVSLVQIDGLK